MVIELNPEIIRQERSPYRPNFIFGDAVQEEVLLHAGIKRARTLVVVVSEEEAIPRIIHAARNLSPSGPYPRKNAACQKRPAPS